MKKFFIVAIILLQIRCSEDQSEEPIQVPLILTEVTPADGKRGTLVEITGTGFNESASENTVTFNGQQANITSATSTKLIVEVPIKAGTGEIVVRSKDKSATGPIFKYLVTATVTTFAGGEYGYADGNGSAAKFKGPAGLAFDASGNLFVADRSDNRIRKITPEGEVSTVAGNGVGGHMDGNAELAEFNVPMGIAVDNAGNVYVADKVFNFIRKITPSKFVSTIAGSGFNGYKDDVGLNAIFNNPTDIVIDPSGNLIVMDQQNNTIRKISPDAVVTTFSGKPHDYNPPFMDGAADVARFSLASAIAIDMDGNLIVADRDNNRIRKVSTNGSVTTLAGNGTYGFVNGVAASAQFALPSGVGVDANGNIYISDERNHCIRIISVTGEVTTLAGTGTAGDVGGDGDQAKFNNPLDVIVDNLGNIFVSDYLNHKIKKIVLE